ncbi:MAG TPA: aldo/keto reductase [Tepidisphaeraceae bacterium]|jgi:predicted aldo/keto reductase-like oxidoreductase
MSVSTPSGGLTDLSKYVYGTTRLGDDKLPTADRVKIARAAMDAGVWFHTSHQYGNALEVLRTAFDEDRARVPKIIYKIGWSSIAELRETIAKNIGPLGLNHMDVGQLCLGGDLAEAFRTGDPACYDGLRQLKEEGLVRRLVVEVFPWTSRVPLDAIRGGWAEGVIDGYIFYLNPLQRFASNELWAEIQKRNLPVIAMRTVSGGSVLRLRDVPGAAWKPYLHDRAVEVAPLFEQSGIQSWTEFCVRFAYGVPQVRATVGSTARAENLNEFLASTSQIKPLPAEIQQQIETLQRRWSDETDVHAEPWSM